MAAVRRDNVMIKVPGTEAGLPAIRQLLGEGINVNITLLFAQTVYEKVAEAYLAGARAFRRGRRRSEAARERRELLREPHRHRDRPPHRRALRDNTLSCDSKGKVAIANAKLAYQRYKRIFSGARWEALARQGRAAAAAAVGQHRHQEQGL